MHDVSGQSDGLAGFEEDLYLDLSETAAHLKHVKLDTAPNAEASTDFVDDQSDIYVLDLDGTIADAETEAQPADPYAGLPQWKADMLRRKEEAKKKKSAVQTKENADKYGHLPAWQADILRKRDAKQATNKTSDLTVPRRKAQKNASIASAARLSRGDSWLIKRQVSMNMNNGGDLDL